MSGKDLFEGMSYVDERFVDEAENKSYPKFVVSSWIKVASMAACLCLIIFNLYNLQPYLRGETEGIAGEDVSDSMPEGVIEDKVDQEAEINIPAEGSAGEIPNTILYVEEMTADGFIATVTEFGETSRLGLGTKLNVVIRDEDRHDSANADQATSNESKTDYTGCYVLVQYYEFDPDTNTIVIDSVYIIDEEG